MGGAGNDTLVGGGGARSLDGGAGSDTVSYAERAGPVTVDLANGIAPDGDVLVSIENVEGTAGDDIFYGNGDINVFTGGLGNDTYFVQNTGDYIVEGANAGIDTVNTIVSYTLSANVENLIAGGTDAISLTGNDLNNVITGNSGDNVINGGLGADVMSGGAGNDIYYADNAGDVINDSSGNDTVVVSGNVSLANFVGIENIMLSATGDISLDGNEFGNTVTGNNGANVLNGLGGDDVLEGLGGNDVLNGGDGNDLSRGATATTCSTGARATTSSRGATVSTSSMALPATTPSMAAPARTRSTAARARTCSCSIPAPTRAPISIAWPISP